METGNLSSLELLLLGIEQPASHETMPPPRRGEFCPRCGKGGLEYNGTLQLECPACGFVNAEGGGCT